MSATLTWFSSGLGTKTGTTNAAMFTDIVAVFATKAADANFSWVVASSSTAGPLYIVLKPKSGAVGRILLVMWAVSPAGNNTAILDGAPSVNYLYVAYFPNGNVDTPSNLTAASGTILGNDAGAVKVIPFGQPSTIYGASIAPFYFDSQEAIFFGFNNPANNTTFGGAAGNIIVDASDTAYPAVMGCSTSAGWQTLGSSSASPMPWVVTANLAGSTNSGLRTNYGSNNRVYYQAWTANGSWASVGVSSTDIMTDAGNSKAWFVPVQMLGLVKGEGFVLKLRQIAHGPGTLGAFQAYQTSGPTVQARQFNAATGGSNGSPWLTNFKL